MGGWGVRICWLIMGMGLDGGKRVEGGVMVRLLLLEGVVTRCLAGLFLFVLVEEFLLL